MVQMTAQDQAIVKAIPGNSMCCDCGMKNPQWASISFGNVFCLECSGVHRSLGVHITFVRSIAMDSWTEPQLKLMKMGGNDKCNAYLAAKGIDKRTPIKQKYESDAAQLYKHVLKARAEGQPEPTVLPKPAPKSGGSAHAGSGPRDANGMERLPGETDNQYIARQTRLREEAKARMAAKFGGSGMGGGSNMKGMGSDPSYDPNRSSMSEGFGMGSLATGLGSVYGMASSVTSSVLSTDNVNAVKSTGASFWGSLTAGVSTVANTVVGDDDGDGLADLQRQVASQKPMQSKYGGFGNDNAARSSMPSSFPSAPVSGGGGGSGGMTQEAQGLPGEDRNGIGRLTGENEDQYVVRQTRLRDEARARMAAKFGGQSLTSASSTSFGGAPRATSTSSSGSGGGPVTEAPGMPGEDRNGIARLTGESDDQYVVRQTRLRDEAKARMAAKFGGGGAKLSSASSGSAPSSANGSWQPPVTKSAPQRSVSADKSVNSDDFFSSFGT